MVSMSYYPIFVEMAGRRCLVIGGGRVAEGKVQGLLSAEADVTVVAPDLTPALQELLTAGRIRWQQRAYAEGDLEGYEVCFVATDDGAVNAEVAADGKRRGIWVNAADDPANCDFILPSVIRQGQVVVAASTGGASPALARRLREELTDFLSEDFAPLADLLNEVRLALRERKISVDAETWQLAIDGRLRALLAQRRYEEARERLIERLGVKEALAEQQAIGNKPFDGVQDKQQGRIEA
jgi:siroheme synthase-like protein